MNAHQDALLLRLRRAEELQAEHAGDLNAQGEMLLRRMAFAAYYELRQQGREGEARRVVAEQGAGPRE